jgi:hypothetical protein
VEGNPRIQLDLPELIQRSCQVSKLAMCVVVCVLSGRKCRCLKQRYAMKFCVKLGKSGTETLQLLRTAYGDPVAFIPSPQVVQCLQGRAGIEDEQRAGRPSTSRTENSVARVKAVLVRYRNLSEINGTGGRTTCVRCNDTLYHGDTIGRMSHRLQTTCHKGCEICDPW